MLSILPPGESSPKVGPYQLLDRLGRGGMGEVYRGYDARLERYVALKRVHRGVGDPEKALRRFQREARAAARLHHPAIVQVHDWVESEGDAWLVMELVAGTSLREVLRAGPLAEERALALARDLLEGLAVAHDAGLVHRDLKAENVMISPASSTGRSRGEQAKILDFGLARQATLSDEESRLSVEGKIIGTLSALAPEQVLGQDLDGRTDLFALGCLLYEALTGARPFVGASAGETLNRICTVQPLPLQEHRADLSPSLVAFVEHLLQKDPRRRPASAHAALDELDRLTAAFDAGLAFLPSLTTQGLPTAEAEAVVVGLDTDHQQMPKPLSRQGSASADTATPWPSSWRLAAALAVLIGLSFAAGWHYLGPAAVVPTVYVVVPETRLEASPERQEEAAIAASAIHASLLQGLANLRGIAVREPYREASLDNPLQLAREMAADELLLSRLSCDQHGCRAWLQRLAGNDGHILWAQAFTADPAQLLDLGQAVLSYLPNAYPGSEARSPQTSLAVRPADYETYLRLYQRYLRRDRKLSSEDLLAELARLGASSPRFIALPLLEANAALQLFYESRQATYLEQAKSALARASTLAPQDPQVLLLAARVARQAGDLDTAAERLEEVRRLEPGNVEALLQQALLFERKGEAPKALLLARDAAERRPSIDLLLNVSDLFYRQGDVAGARQFLELALERAPDSFGGLSRLAQLELSSGSLERAAELYSRLVARSPETAELGNLGTALMMLRRYDEAAETFTRVVAISPSSPHAALNLADVELLRGKTERAAELYRQVVKLVEGDPQPDSLASIKAQALAHLGRREEAVAALQVALRLRPDHPWTAYEAALVYALIDDRSSAIWNARRALALGIEKRWFSLPHFDAVRQAFENPG